MIDTEKAECERLIRLLTEKLRETVDENDRLRAENEQLTSALDAHGFLQSVWRDPTQPVSARVRAAQAALNVEKAPLKPQPPPLDLIAEPVIPLAELVTQRRARQNALVGQEIEVSPSGAVRVLPKPGSNGGSDDSDDDTFG